MAEPRINVRLEERAEGRLAWITIERPAQLNALSSDLLTALAQALDELAADDDLRCAILTGAGSRAFVGGADIGEMGQITSPDGARAFILRVHRACKAVRDLPCPVIGRINGYALGAGMELAAACDMRIAAEGAVFGMPEVRLGIPSVVEAALLPALVGWGRARRMLLTGETFDAGAALAMGFVDEVAADLDAAVEAAVGALLDCGPRAVRLQKALIRRWEDLPLSEAVAAGVESFAAAFETDEPAMRMAAHQAGRAARSKGA